MGELSEAPVIIILRGPSTLHAGIGGACELMGGDGIGARANPVVPMAWLLIAARYTLGPVTVDLGGDIIHGDWLLWEDSQGFLQIGTPNCHDSRFVGLRRSIGLGRLICQMAISYATYPVLSCVGYVGCLRIPATFYLRPLLRVWDGGDSAGRGNILGPSSVSRVCQQYIEMFKARPLHPRTF
eukprot:1187715-Prorocentrum_minimum.AAC.2